MGLIEGTNTDRVEWALQAPADEGFYRRLRGHSQWPLGMKQLASGDVVEVLTGTTRPETVRNEEQKTPTDPARETLGTRVIATALPTSPNNGVRSLPGGDRSLHGSRRPAVFGVSLGEGLSVFSCMEDSRRSWLHNQRVHYEGRREQSIGPGRRAHSEWRPTSFDV